MPAPPAAPRSAAATAPVRRGMSAANTVVHHSVTRACATRPRARPGRPSSSPAARAAASGDRWVLRACTVDGTPLSPPASSAATSTRPGLGRSGRTELDPEERLAVAVAAVDDRIGALIATRIAAHDDRVVECSPGKSHDSIDGCAEPDAEHERADCTVVTRRWFVHPGSLPATPRRQTLAVIRQMSESGTSQSARVDPHAIPSVATRSRRMPSQMG